MLIGNKDNGKQPMPKVAPMPMPQRAKHQHTDIGANHPAVVEHIAKFNDMAAELDRLRADNAQLANLLEIEKRINAELLHTCDAERAEKEKFQRYSVEMRTHAIDIHQKTGLMLEASRDAAINKLPERIEPPPVDEIEAGVAEIARKFAPKHEQPEPQ